MLNILNATSDRRADLYQDSLIAALESADIPANVAQDLPPEDVDYIVYAPDGPVQDFTAFTNCKAVMSTWAGVERIVGNETLTQPLTRMVDDGLRQGMVEWVTGHVLRHHLGMDDHIVNPDHVWDPVPPKLAKDRPVCILGLGELGQACGQALAGLGFPVRGWTRSPRQVDGIACYAGQSGLREALTGAEIIVLLLPATPDTENVINADTLSLMASSAFLINPGRGPLIDDNALIAALDQGQITHATLDVFRIEPLPADHPYWSHPQVTVTPHIASETRIDTAVEVIVTNIRRNEAGEGLRYLVDRGAGY